MTVISQGKKNSLGLIKSFAAFLLLFLSAVFLSGSIAKETLNGIRFSVEVILPSVFPFMVFSDFASHMFAFEENKAISSAFERIFKINGCAISALLSGMAGGFPVGAKAALNLYNNGKISKCECQRLMSFANLPSPAYVISAVGIGILSSFKLGIILYFTSVFSSLICGIIIGSKKKCTHFFEHNVNKNYSFVGSLKNSASASVNLIFFVSFFSAICGLIKSAPLPEFLKPVLIAFSEVGNASAYMSDLCIFSARIKIALIAFSLSFSGISVLMQGLALEGGDKMSISKCLLYKLLCGVISFIIILLLPIKI